MERRHVSDWDPSTEFNENGSPGVQWVQLAEAWRCPWPEAFDELKRLLVAASETYGRLAGCLDLTGRPVNGTGYVDSSRKACCDETLRHDSMGRRFFDLCIDVYVPGRWYMSEPTLPDGQEVDDVWAFTRGKRIAPPGLLRIPIYRPGVPLDFTTAGVGMTPILSARAASVFRAMAPEDTQLFPVGVEGQTDNYHLLVVTRTVRCIDDKSCEDARYFTPEDGRPERVGEYQVVSGLRIDKSKVGSACVFKTWGWRPALIVDEQIKAALEQTGISGGYFKEV